MAFSTELLTILVIVALGLAALSLFLLATTAAPRRRRRDAAAPPPGAAATLQGQADAIRRLQASVEELTQADARLKEHLATTVQRVGLVRYDAFEDMGGHLSFSLALLDQTGHGVVVSAINGRQDTRVYAKPVQAGESGHNLSEEEGQAIQQAMAGSAVSA